MDERGATCVKMGYSMSQKGYKLLDLSTYEIKVTRNVKFHEKRFPYHLFHRKNNSNYVFSTTI